MKSLYTIILLVFVLLVSGCVAKQKEVERKTEAPVETIVPPAPVEVQNETQPVIAPPAEKTNSIINEKLVAAGENPALAIYGGKLWIAFERFTGTADDIYAKSFDGKSFDKDILVEGSDIDDIHPSAIAYLGNLYVFFTQTIPRSQTASIYYRIYNGRDWSSRTPVGDLDSIFYYHNSSAILSDGNVLLFWTKGTPTDYGFVSSRLLKKEYWFDGITLTGIAAVTNDRNPKATIHEKDIVVMYDNYVPNGERNDVYVKRYADGFWSTGVKLTADRESTFKSAGSIASFNGKLYAIWVENGELYMKTSGDGLSWEKAIRLTNNDVIDDEPQLTEYNGILYLAFTRYSGDAPFVYLSKLDV